jgi:hypothetical protein
MTRPALRQICGDGRPLGVDPERDDEFSLHLRRDLRTPEQSQTHAEWRIGAALILGFPDSAGQLLKP